MKRLLLFLLPVLAISCSAGIQTEPVTKAEALAFAARIDSGIKAGDVRTLNKAIDPDVFAQDVAKAAKEPYSAKFRDGLMTGLNKRKIAEPIIEDTKSGGTYELVRQYEKGGEQHVIFRLFGSAGLNYHDFALVKRENQVRARDFYIMLTGENISETLANLGNSLTASGGTSSEMDRQARQMQQLSDLVRRKDYPAAKALIEQLPPDMKKTRAVQVMNVTVCSELDSSVQKKALADFEARFGNNPESQFALFDYYFMKGDYDKVLRIIDGLDRQVQDPLLDYYRALVYKQAGKPDEAKAKLEKLMRSKPDFEAGALELIALYADGGQIAEANKAIAAYKANPKFDQNTLQRLRTAYPDASSRIAW